MNELVTESGNNNDLTFLNYYSRNGRIIIVIVLNGNKVECEYNEKARTLTYISNGLINIINLNAEQVIKIKKFITKLIDKDLEEIRRILNKNLIYILSKKLAYLINLVKIKFSQALDTKN